MRVNIVKIGNSRGIRIPKPLLEQAGIADTADMTIEAGRLVLSPADPPPRAGWARELDRLLAADGEDSRDFTDFRAPATGFDAEEWTWPDDAGKPASADEKTGS